MTQQARLHSYLSTFLLLALALCLNVARDAGASNVQFVGSGSYSYVGNTAVLTADQVSNFDVFGYSGTLHLELWASNVPYTGSAISGYKLAQYSLGSLTAGFYLSGISSGSIPFTYPPNGTWYFTMLLTEYTGAAFNNGYVTRDWINFSQPVVIGAPPPPPPPPLPPPPPSVSPQPGLWWNPNESGTGYSLDYSNGTLVVLVYSFNHSGASTWYISSGKVVGNVFSQPLNKFANGQCIDCGYLFPTVNGNDGMMTITFTSATTGIMTLPGGRYFNISRYTF